MTDPIKLKPLSSSGQISLKTAWMYYFICLFSCIVTGLICYKLDLLFLMAVPYLTAGIFLNRKVLRNLVGFHPIYDTLNNVANTKMSAIIAWPSFYVVIFIKIAITRYL